ncbi:hypothetical protein IAU59_003996 [Kwoniella sp. CBS 9459]
MDAALLENLIASAERLRHTCNSNPSYPTIKTSGLYPRLRTPSPIFHIPEHVSTQLGRHRVSAVRSKIKDAVEAQKRMALTEWRSTIQTFISLEQFGGTDDATAERLLCRLYEELFAKQVQKIQLIVSRAIEEQFAGVSKNCPDKKSSSFSPYTLAVLDAAYARSKSLTQAETAIIAKAAGISPAQVRTWFQNKRNRRKDKHLTKLNVNVPATSTANRPVSSLPKRAQQHPQQQPQQQVKLGSPVLSPAPRRVRGLPKRAAQVSHNAPNTHIADSSLGTYQPSYTSSEASQDHDDHQGYGGERMTRSASFASTSSNSTELPNGGFISPYEMHVSSSSSNGQPTSSSSGHGMGMGSGEGMTQIAIEWGTGMLNIPIEALGDGQAPVFNFTPPSPLNVGFDPTFNLANYASSSNTSSDGFTFAQSSSSGMVDSPIEMGNGASHFPFSFPDNLDLTEGLESIESILTEALSDPKSFEHFSTLAASPQISLDSLSPRSDSSESPGQEYYDGAYDFKGGYPSGMGSGSLDEIEGDFFNALEGLLASPGSSFSPSGAVELGSPIALEKRWDPSTYTTPQYIRSMSMTSDISYDMDGHFNNGTGMGQENEGGSAIIDASQGIDLSYIASIPLPASPTSSTFSLPRDYAPSPSFPAGALQATPDRATSVKLSSTQQQLSVHAHIDNPSMVSTPYTPEKMTVERSSSRGQWEWVGALPFEMEMMEVDVIEGGSPDSVMSKGWEGGMSGFGGMVVQ